MTTTVYQLNKHGDIKELADYTLPPRVAIRNAYLQFIKRNFNTWEYDDINVSIKEDDYSYYIYDHDNDLAIFVQKEGFFDNHEENVNQR